MLHRVWLALLFLSACGSNTATPDAAVSSDPDGATPLSDAREDAPAGTCAPDFFAGLGTEASPYLLCRGEQLGLIGADANALGAVYSMSGDIIVPANFITIGPVFDGELRGNAHAISNLGSEGAPRDTGLFEATGSQAKVSDLRITGFLDRAEQGSPVPGTALLTGRNAGLIENVAVAGTVRAPNHAGLLVGINEASGTIETCQVEGVLEATAHAGGVVGRNQGSVTKCNSAVTVSGVNRQGGVVGTQDSGSITQCSSTASVTGTNIHAGCLVGTLNAGSVSQSEGRCSQVSGATGTGGLIGFATAAASITNSYAWTLSVTGSVSSGGLVGASDEAVPTTSSYFNSEVTATSAAGTALTAAELVQESSFVGWDFQTVWIITAGNPPTLLWPSSQTPGS